MKIVSFGNLGWLKLNNFPSSLFPQQFYDNFFIKNINVFPNKGFWMNDTVKIIFPIKKRLKEAIEDCVNSIWISISWTFSLSNVAWQSIWQNSLISICRNKINYAFKFLTCPNLFHMNFTKPLISLKVDVFLQ